MTGTPPLPWYLTEADKNDCDLDFSVELEFIAAFQQDQLQFSQSAQLAKRPEKNLDYNIRARDQAWSLRNTAPGAPSPEPFFTLNDQRTCPNRVYHSWGVRERIPVGLTNGTTPTTRIVPYADEPLQVVRRFLAATIGVVDCEFSVPKVDRTDAWYLGINTWRLTNSERVVGVGSENIPGYLPRVTANTAEEWDSYGVTLISRKFAPGPNVPAGRNNYGRFSREVTGITNALKLGNENFGAFVNNQCAIKVNISLPQDRYWLLNMQKLALLLTVYEEVISSMHPPARRPYHLQTRHHDCARYHVESNRLAFVMEPDLSNRADVNGPPGANQGPNAPTTYGNIDVSNEKLAEKDFGDIYFAIMNTTNERELARLMNWPAKLIDPADPASGLDCGNENRQFSFVGATKQWEGHPGDHDYPRFLQFRQAKGSLSDEDIKHWVEFCINLVWLACTFDIEDDFELADPWGSVMRTDGSIARTKLISVFDLMKRMNYTDSQMDYWKKRISEMGSYTNGDENDVCDIERPPRGYTYPPPNLPGNGPPPDYPPTPPASPPNDDDMNYNPRKRRWPDPDRGTDGGPKSAQNRGPRADRARRIAAALAGRRIRQQEQPRGGTRLPKGGKGNAPKQTPIRKTRAQVIADALAKFVAEKARLDQANRDADALKQAALDKQTADAAATAAAAKQAADKLVADAAAAAQKLIDDAAKNSKKTADERKKKARDDEKARLAALGVNMPFDAQNPEEGMIAPAGQLATDEDMIYDGFGWRSLTFDPAEWSIRDVPSRMDYPTGGPLRGICGLYALIASMTRQYPTEPLRMTNVSELITIHRAMKQEGWPITDGIVTPEFLDEVLNRWTGGVYRLIVWERTPDDIIPSATRFGLPMVEQVRLGRNLYLMHETAVIDNNGAGYIGGHYQSMRKRPAP